MAFDSQEDRSAAYRLLKATGASKLLVHFDLDVLDPKHFRAQLFNHPEGHLADQFAGIATGKLTFGNVIDLLNRGSEIMDIVALSITDLPWDTENLQGVGTIADPVAIAPSHFPAAPGSQSRSRASGFTVAQPDDLETETYDWSFHHARPCASRL
ncbi:hypothetical protein [Rhizobium leguminosarum]|uniref:hypothetical protein n=1 Tax=Rhizobium leguminosarum TaxID=384 RepID=UPI0014414F4C|nr:hypothetical protein [Rhizobium leguminosarum]